MFDTYSTTFSKLKPNRKLKWLPNLGHVRIVLELEDRTFDMSVTPVHAACIHHFSIQKSWEITRLAAVLEMDDLNTRRALGFWIKQGIVKESEDDEGNGTGTYSVLETVDTSLPLSSANPGPVVEEGSGSAVQSVEESEADEMKIYWSFVVGMLTNVGTLPIDRIHSMLGMFAPSYNRSSEELREFLSRMIKEECLEFKGGVYRLIKAD